MWESSRVEFDREIPMRQTGCKRIVVVYKGMLDEVAYERMKPRLEYFKENPQVLPLLEPDMTAFILEPDKYYVITSDVELNREESEKIVAVVKDAMARPDTPILLESGLRIYEAINPPKEDEPY